MSVDRPHHQATNCRFSLGFEHAVGSRGSVDWPDRRIASDGKRPFFGLMRLGKERGVSFPALAHLTKIEEVARMPAAALR